MINTSLAPLLSSVKMDWNTPESFLTLVRQLAGGQIALDPCTDETNPCKAKVFYTPNENGLQLDWAGEGLAYANSPYGKAMSSWAKKFAHEGTKRELLALMPARPDTKWFQENVVKADALCFWKGRIKFVGARDPAPFPSLVAYWGPNTNMFKEIFGKVGWIP